MLALTAPGKGGTAFSCFARAACIRLPPPWRKSPYWRIWVLGSTPMENAGGTLQAMPLAFRRSPTQLGIIIRASAPRMLLRGNPPRY